MLINMSSAVINLIIRKQRRKFLKEKTKGQSDFEGFHARSDSKLRYDNKNQTQLNSRIVHTVSYLKTKQNKTAMMKNIAKLA